MRILITAASNWENAADYKSKLKDFKYESVVEQYRNHEITNMQAVKMLGISRANFFRLLKQ